MGHFYHRDGRSAYTIDGKDTTLREARKHMLVPSVTEILQVVAKPALVSWMQDQAILAALTMPRVDGEREPEYIARIKSDSKKQAINAANIGTMIHDACETYVRGDGCRDEYRPHAEAAAAELRHLFPKVDDWVVEQSFAHPLGFGGKCDLHSPSTGIIADYKTKDGDFSDGKKLGWDQHWQLAAYAVGLGLYLPPDPFDTVSNWNDPKPGAAIFISRTHPGKVASYVWSADEMAQGWKVFEAALQLHKLLKNYDGAF